MDAPLLLDHLSADIATIAEVTRTGDPAAPVAGCPGWTLGDLVAHLGRVHRWAAYAALHAAAPPRDVLASDPAPSGSAALAGWLVDGGTRLLDVLRGLDPDAPTWHPFPVPLVASLWPRRQAQEASVHRWDAEHAVGRVPSIDPALATDGIDEYFTVMLRRSVTSGTATAPGSVLRVRCTDTGGSWTVRGDHSDVVAVSDEPDALLEGEAQWLLLRLWGRPVPDGVLTVGGDAGEAAAWLALGGV